MKNIFLIRHSESTKNINGLFGDENSSFGLTKKGESDTILLAKLLKSFWDEHNNSQLYTSPDSRSLLTTKIISQTTGYNFDIIKSLKPINAGKLSGISEEAANKLYPELMNKKRLFRDGLLNGYQITYPEGESVFHFQNRIMEELNNLISDSKNSIFIVTHQSVITAILSYCKAKLLNQNYYYYFKIDLCSISNIINFGITYHIRYTNKNILCRNEISSQYY